MHIHVSDDLGGVYTLCYGEHYASLKRGVLRSDWSVGVLHYVSDQHLMHSVSFTSAFVIKSTQR